MSGFIYSFLSKPAVKQALRLSQQTNSDSLSNNDRPIHCPNPQDTAFSANITSGNDMKNGAMSDRDQYSGSGVYSSGGRDAGSESDIPVPTTSLPSLSGNQPLNARHSSPSGHTEYNSGTGSLRSLSSTAETTPSNASSMLSQALLASAQRHTPYGTTPSSQDANEHPTNTIENGDTGSQTLLPEDDGMGVLRRRIHAIRDLNSTNTEQARMIHNLMTENYNASRKILSGDTVAITSSPLSSRSPERPSTSTTRWSGQSFDQLYTPSTSTASVLDQPCYHNLTAEDLKPTFHPKTETDLPVGDDDIDTEEFEDLYFGCQHYKRNVKLQCYDCKKWYTCRFCHDEIENHHLDRPKTENMLCMFCGHAQSAGQFCKECGEMAAQYYCTVCKLWDNDSNKSIYHCNDCGICRIGKGLGKDFFHCKTCSVCLPISIETTHRCIERSTQCDCPICGDYMFTSPETVVFMRCGHSIHQRCLSEYSKSSYRCPICSKTITNMETTFRNLDRTIQSQPMPAEFKDTRALIYCNDCSTKSVVKYHWLGLRCDMCESYNTAQLRLLQGDSLDFPEQDDENEGFLPSRLRSSSQGADESVLSALSSLQFDPSSAPGSGADPRFIGSSSVDAHGYFSSYNLTRGRAVSPVISNYFGIPTDREPERSKPTSFFGGQLHQTARNDGDGDGELYFWGTKFKYSYGFLGRGAEAGNAASEAKDEEDEEGSGSSESDDPEDDDDDDGESIDIFGHR